MSKKPRALSVSFQKFEAAAKQVLAVPKKDFDKALASRPRRPKKPAGAH